MKYSEVSEGYLNEWVAMALTLWPDAKKAELNKEFKELLASSTNKTFICTNKDDKPIAFINLSLRNDYVEGAENSHVAYIEGIYVDPEYRKKGVAKNLIKLGEKWTLKQKCKELASNAELNNVESHKFHKKLGFKEVNKTVNFIKKIPNI